MEESTTLQTTSTLALLLADLAYRHASMVSRLSPDWLTPTTRLWASSTGSRYRNSLATSISVGSRAQCSMA